VKTAVTAKPKAQNSPTGRGLLQRACACGGTPGLDGMCDACRAKALRRKSATGNTAARGAGQRASATRGLGEAPPIVHDVLRSPGRPLDRRIRPFMEERFGHDFAQVRVHTDARASESAREVNAVAYTVGQNIVFDGGSYRPDAPEGRGLIAHELAHVVQQAGLSASTSPLRVAENDHAEYEANAASRAVLSGSSANVGARIAARVQRQPKPTVPTPAGPGSPSCMPRLGVTEYGCYCGEGASCTSGLNCTPTDPLDACCQEHDKDYAAGGCTFGDRFNPFSPCFAITRRADSKLCACAGRLAGSFHGETERYRVAMRLLFCKVSELSGPAPAGPASPTPATPAGPVPAPAPTPTSPSPASGGAAPPCVPGVIRRADLRPIFFKDAPADPAPTGRTWLRRLLPSNTIWQKLGVTFTALSPITMVDPLNKTAGSTEAERDRVYALWSGPGIGIFALDNDLADAGGGETLGQGAGAKVAMADRGTSNTLLAHELGHVLGLGHPPADADSNTIMEPSGSHSSPNPTRNTLGNYTRIVWPPGSGSTCINPDP
jgi:hypothetical protein